MSRPSFGSSGSSRISSGQIRQDICKSLFERGIPKDHGNLVPCQIHHLRVSELMPGNPEIDAKTRYILLAVTSDGQLWIHKSKRNSNGTFSIGKTWGISELMVLEVNTPASFCITLNSKTYMWDTNNPHEQIEFLVSLVRCFRAFMGQNVRVIGFDVNEPINSPPPYTIPEPKPDATGPPPLPQQQLQPQTQPMRQGPSSASNFSTSSAAPSSVQSRGHAKRLSQSARNLPVPPPIVSTGSNSSFGSNTQSLSGSVDSAGRGTLPRMPPQQPSQSRHQKTTSFSGQDRQRSIDAPSSSQQQPPRLPNSGSSRSIRSSMSIPPPDRSGTPPPHRTASPTFSQSSPSRRSNIDGSPRKPPSTTRLSSLNERSPPRIQAPRPNFAMEPDESLAQGRSASSLAQQPPSPSIALPGRDGVEEEDEDEGEEQSRDPKTPHSAVPSGLARGLLPPEEDQTLANVEEMLEGFEWRPLSSLVGGVGASLSDLENSLQSQIEQSLVGELGALEKASIHAIVESDDRVEGVLGHLNDAMAELDRLDQMITLYKTQLNVVGDDIDHIEGQNKGLQVELSNQRALVDELNQLLDTINIPRQDLEALTKESLEKRTGIERLEKAAIGLYKAVLSMRDKAVGDMAAASERGADYQRYSTQFCKRLLDFLSAVFSTQTKQIMDSLSRQGPITKLKPHTQLEEYLERYVGLMLFVKEIDEQRYHQICAAYFTNTSDMYRTEIAGLFNFHKSMVRKPTEDELDANFTAMARSQQPGALKRPAGRNPGKPSKTGEQVSGGEAFRRALLQVGPHLHREQTFIADLLHVTGFESFVTFAEWMELETYFRRIATDNMTANSRRFKDLKQSLGLIFGFLSQILNDTATQMMKQDPIVVVGLLAAIDQSVEESTASNNHFFLEQLEKLGLQCARQLQQLVNDQIQAIEQTKLTVKKRKGVVPFIRVFPLFVERVESQLFGCESLPIRSVVDEKYDTIVSAMFDCLQQMAKMGQQAAAASSAEDKDQLNYHIVLIENMSHFNTVARELQVSALGGHVSRARDIYDENLAQYIKIVLRRPFPRLIEFFTGLESLLRSTPPNEVGMHSGYNKSSAKKACGSVGSKDMRKGVEALSKRVEKHFTDISSPSAENAAVLASVWQACMDETLRLTSSWQSLITRCYPEKNVSLEFTLEDVDSTFKRNKPSAASS